MTKAQKIDPEFFENFEKTDLKRNDPADSSDNSTYQNVERPPKERGEFLKAIQIIKNYDDDWDGNNAPAPHPQAIKTAELFISKLPWQREFPRSIRAGNDKSIVFEWKKDQHGAYLLLSIDPYHIGAIVINGDGKLEDKGNFVLLPDAKDLPKELQDIIARS